MRIVLTGPESCGKSSLARQLAEHFSIPYAPEFARSFLEQQGPHYTYDMLGAMAASHLVWQRQQVPPDVPLAILDTDLLTYNIWSEAVFGNCHPDILKSLPSEQHHRYLLCRPDLPWEADPLRENPNDRDALFQKHIDILQEWRRPYKIIEGLGETRTQAAIGAFENLLTEI